MDSQTTATGPLSNSGGGDYPLDPWPICSIDSCWRGSRRICNIQDSR